MGAHGSTARASSIVELNAEQLYNLQADGSAFPLLLDVRPASSCFRIDGSVLSGSSPKDAVALVAKRRYSDVVLITETGMSSTVSHRLVNELEKHCGAASVRLCILTGGADAFRCAFPFLCTDHAYFVEGRLMPSLITSTIDREGPAIFLSNFGVASSPGALRLLSITHVINCTPDCPFPPCTAHTTVPARSVDALVAELREAQDDGDPYQIACAQVAMAEGRMEVDLGPAPPLRTLRIPVVDEADQDIASHFDRAIAFVNEAFADEASARAAGGGEGEADAPPPRILFHCKHGQSRSATVLAAWLIAQRGHSVDSAVQWLQQCRPRVGPNHGFMQQLREFAAARAGPDM